MNYNDIINLALSYADRKDSGVVDNIDNFIAVAEARINRVLKVRKMSSRAIINTIDGQSYYGLPFDFSSLRNISLKTTSDDITAVPLKYLTPEQINTFSSAETSRTNVVAYTIVADQLQIIPPQDDKVIEIIYYQTLTNLSIESPSNWLSASNPEVYIFGIMVEISSFVKDGEAKALWDARFKEELSLIIEDDAVSKYSGTLLTIKIG